MSSWRTLVLSHYAVTADQNGAQSPEMEVYSVITLCYKNTRINTMMKFKTKKNLKISFTVTTSGGSLCLNQLVVFGVF